MVANWVKSMHCKSSKMVQEVHDPIRKRLLPLIPPSSSCRFSVQTIKEAIEAAAAEPRPNPRKKPKPRSPSSPKLRNSASTPELSPTPIPRSISTRSAAADTSLKELEKGHPSRNVVEIIFHSSWSPKAFPGWIDTIFKVQNSTPTVARFEEYREMVRRQARTGPHARDGASRCVADGNEVMRFHCLGPTISAFGFDSGKFADEKLKDVAVSTYSGSGAAHERSGGGIGGRAMLVCRVIAGRVSKQLPGADSSGFDSVGKDTGELVVLDSRAVLPCFLVIYRL